MAILRIFLLPLAAILELALLLPGYAQISKLRTILDLSSLYRAQN